MHAAQAESAEAASVFASNQVHLDPDINESCTTKCWSVYATSEESIVA